MQIIMKVSDKIIKNVLVTGGMGQLGSEINKLSILFKDYNFFIPNSSELNITIHKDVEKYINYNNIKIIINCAAYTKVDKAESNFEIANQINHLDVANLALLAKKHNIKLVHISTDYVFDGTSQITIQRS